MKRQQIVDLIAAVVSDERSKSEAMARKAAEELRRESLIPAYVRRDPGRIGMLLDAVYHHEAKADEAEAAIVRWLPVVVTPHGDAQLHLASA